MAEIRPVIETKQLSVNKPLDKFYVSKKIDLGVFLEKSVQIRLEDDGEIYLSTINGGIRTLKHKRISFEELFNLINTILE